MLAFLMEVVMTHKARFVGVKKAKRYLNRPPWDSTPYEAYQTSVPLPFDRWSDDNLIWEGELPLRTLKADDYIYLSNIKETVKVTGVLVSSEGVFTYLTTYVLEEIEDDDTALSKQQTESTYAEYLAINPPIQESGPSIFTRAFQRLFRRSEH